MKPKYFQKLMEVALDRVVANYIKRLLSRSITFTKYEERLEVGEKICKDSDRIKVRERDREAAIGMVMKSFDCDLFH